MIVDMMHFRAMLSKYRMNIQSLLTGYRPAPPPPQLLTSHFSVPYLDHYQLQYADDSNRFRLVPTDFSWNDLEILPLPQLAALLQSWLFFGLLSDFFDRRIICEDYVERAQDGQQRVLLRPKVFRSLDKAFFRECHSEDPLKRINSARKAVTGAVNRVRFFDRVLKHSPDSDAELHHSHLGSVLLSIELLCWHLGQIVNSQISWFSDSKQAKYGLRQLSIDSPLGVDSLVSAKLAKLFHANGWCPNRTCQIMDRFEDVLLSYRLSGIDRGEALDNIDHSMCRDGQKCAAYNMSDEQIANYQTVHAKGCDLAECRILPVSPIHLQEIVEAGNLPIVSVDTRATKLEVKPCTSQTQFFAISHVWSDGLGNMHMNDLPQCQLRRIAQTIAKLNRKLLPALPNSSPKAHFWIDTLCIPRGDDFYEDAYKLRWKAIRNIPAIFQAATGALVFDPGFENYTDCFGPATHDFDEDHMVSFILASKWSQRAWTYEEGALARKCFIELRTGQVKELRFTRESYIETNDYLVQEPDFHSSDWSSSLNPETYSSSSCSSARLSMISKDFDSIRKRTNRRPFGTGSFLNSCLPYRWAYSKAHEPRFAQIWNNLRTRSCSRPEDLFVIFTFLLDLDPNPLYKEDVNKQFQLIIKSCKEIPFSLLFLQPHTEATPVETLDNWLPYKLVPQALESQPKMTRVENKSELIGFTLPDEADTYTIFQLRLNVEITREDALRFALVDHRGRIIGLVTHSRPDIFTLEEQSSVRYLIVSDLKIGRGRNNITRGAILREIPDEIPMGLKHICHVTFERNSTTHELIPPEDLVEMAFVEGNVVSLKEHQKVVKVGECLISVWR